ncbi:MAG TPA: hypothetical protein PLF40_20035 [Kofleriaceae bacterium]|nr:hypothetical protein [Kofleriaceae bacterium]
MKLRRADPAFAGSLLQSIRALGGCKAELEVFIVKTESGYYLLVRDSLGRMQDRLVPSLELAATLIASFAESPLDVAPLRATPAFDAENPDQASPANAPAARPPEALNVPWGRTTAAVLVGRESHNLQVQAVDVQLDVGRLGQQVAAASVSYQREVADAAVVLTDDNIASFLARRDGIWVSGYLRYASLRTFAVEPTIGLGAAVMWQRRVIASSAPGTLPVYTNDAALALRGTLGLQASYALDSQVRIVTSIQGVAAAATEAGGGVDFAWLAGIGIRYTRQ